MRDEKYRHTFWQLTKEGASAIGVDNYVPVSEKSVANFPHQFGLIDIMAGLYFPFRKVYDINIKYPSTKDSLDGYKPDAIVQYQQKVGNKRYDFIVEFERTRTPKAIFDEKIKINEKIKNFKKFGLSDKTKFLYVYTYEHFDVTKRPVEYPDYKGMIRQVEKQFENLMRIVSKLPDYKYRFAILHHFKEFDRTVWVMPSGRKTKIIS